MLGPVHMPQARNQVVAPGCRTGFAAAIIHQRAGRPDLRKQRGVAAIDLIDFEYPWRDTLGDNLSKVSPRALDVTGETVYTLVDELRRR